MWTRRNCKICKGKGVIDDDVNFTHQPCGCGDYPDYLKLFPEKEWRESWAEKALDGRKEKTLFYAQHDRGPLLIITEHADVFITGLGALPDPLVPKTVEALNKLVDALGMRII